MEDIIACANNNDFMSNEEEIITSKINQKSGNTQEIVNIALQSDGDAKKKKKKEDKNMDNVLKSLNTLETSEEKLQTLSRKYAELLDDHKTLTNTVKQNQRVLKQLNREKDQLQSEHSKAVLAKSKLEGLCRELQRHNKSVKDESIARAKEDEEKRKEVTNKFQTTINEIQQQINEHYERNQHLREENIDLATKMKELINKYEIREQHIENILKSKEIESQLFEAKMQQAALQLTEQKELSLQEKQRFLEETMEDKKRIFILEEQEKQYKSQLEMYTERYAEFQSTLSKSNDVFNTFKSEMEKMSKKMKRLEKDSSGWKAKWETSNKTLLLMVEEKALTERETNLLNTKIGRLESLCRALQEERKTLSSINNLTAGAIPIQSEEKFSKLPISPTDDLRLSLSTAKSTTPSVQLKQDSTQRASAAQFAPTDQRTELPLDIQRSSDVTKDKDLDENINATEAGGVDATMLITSDLGTLNLCTIQDSNHPDQLINEHD